jgi:hypothetical protein
MRQQSEPLFTSAFFISQAELLFVIDNASSGDSPPFNFNHASKNN